MSRFRMAAYRGSHLPVLIKLMSMTTGPVLEMGMGYCSSPFLHWACYPTKRRIVSYESQHDYYRYAETWRADFHEVHCVDDWNQADLAQPWSVAFVDHHPNNRRSDDVVRLTHADYVVIHDSENSSDGHYHLNEIRHQFKYRYKYTAAFPYTSVWSNKHDLKDFRI